MAITKTSTNSPVILKFSNYNFNTLINFDIRHDRVKHPRELVECSPLSRRPIHEKKGNIHNRLKNERKEKNKKIKQKPIRIPKNFNYHDLEELEDQFLQMPLHKINNLNFCALSLHSIIFA